MPAVRRLVSTPQRAGVGTVYRPILDVVRGVVAGYQTTVDPLADRRPDPFALLATALDGCRTLPANTFITVPLPVPELDVDGPAVARLHAHGDLSGVVLDLLDVPEELSPAATASLDRLRELGALVGLGGDDAPQPPLRSVIRIRPSIIRLGRAWVDGIGRSEEKRGAIEVTGGVAAQLDAWILAEGVASPAELRCLAGLGVPLAQGPLVGRTQGVWQDVAPEARHALPADGPTPPDGVLRGLLRRAYTTDHVSSAEAVLPDTTGFDVVVAVDDHRRPLSVLVKDADGRWQTNGVLTVHVDTPVPDAVARALTRPRSVRFDPVVCTDSAGGFLGVLHLEDLMTHLAARA